MAFRRFRKKFDYLNEAGEKITVPRGWAGELPDKVAADADKAKATIEGKAVQGEVKAKAFAHFSKDELFAEAERRRLTVKSSATKAEILAALQAAAAPFAKSLDGLSADEIAAEVTARGITAVDDSDEAAARSALTLAAEPLPE